MGNNQPPVDRVTVTVNKRTVCRITRDHRLLIAPAEKMTKAEMREAMETLLRGTANLMQSFETVLGNFIGDKQPNPSCLCPSCTLIRLYHELQEPHLH